MIQARGSRKWLAGFTAALALCVAFWFLRVERTRVAEAPRASDSTSVALEAARDLAQPVGTEPESRIAAPVAKASSELELLVQSSDNRPVPAAQVAIFRGEELIATGISDASGVTRFAPGEGSAEVAIHAPGWAAARVAIELAAGRRNLTLPEGAILAGWVFVNGLLPVEPVELEFETTKPSPALAQLPASVLQALGPSLMAHGQQFAVTDATGAFSIRGLPADATGELNWHETYFLDTGNPDDISQVRSRRIDALKTDLELRLVAGASLILRVVDPAGAAVGGAGVDVKLGGPTLRAIPNHRGSADGQGLYSCPLGRTPPTGVEVRVARADGSGAATYTLAVPPGTRGVWQVGDLAITDTRTIRVHVQDVDGAPIAGARAVPMPSRSSQAARSDANGDFSLALGNGDLQIMGQALGYESTLVDVPTEADSVVVTLTRTCMLEFTLQDSADIDLMRLFVEVSGAPPIFVDDAPGSLPVLRPWDPLKAKASETGTAKYRTGHFGSWNVVGLRHGIALKVELRSSNGPTLAEVDIPPLAVGEHRKVELALAHRPRSLRVLVLDPDHKPVPAAQAMMHQQLGNNRHTDASGVCVMKSIYAKSFTLEIEAGGFPTKYVHGVTVPPEEISVVLDAPRSLEVELVTPDGSPMTEKIEVRAGETTWSVQQGKQIEAGRWRVDKLPPGEVLVWAGNGKHPPVTQLHDMSTPFVRLVIGHRGSVKANAELAPPTGESFESWSVALISSDGGEVLTRASVYYKRDTRSTAFFSGLCSGSYQLRLETRDRHPPCAWVRVGEPVHVTLDGERSKVEVNLGP